MPHITLDYSPNMEERADIRALCDCLRKAAIATGVFPMPGIRVRALRVDHVSIADGAETHGYIDICVRLREGRDLETRQAAATALFDAARAFMTPVLNEFSVALSLELREIDDKLSPKTSTIRDHIET
ncbi:5-carboxymethyl-2-hydroxymuconate Delta-isomerase [Thalassococcus sp. S3]|uniref:5-carboxymethyl-2-hydroxymuconate Delta-isomerase n=1 Tax=Thalassococcus sp. S3 TaxID=2017482 RepID=UPI00102485D5|nr:5-carboxymethyl-2-hydroxymuconate Delta-isomerase [Thalassococcus sp. S3]QBF29918.1 5-carboxymethyl-2-hydroxymuconate isomerase [Thalassococcus sp. S3]